METSKGDPGQPAPQRDTALIYLSPTLMPGRHLGSQEREANQLRYQIAKAKIRVYFISRFLILQSEACLTSAE